MDPTTQKSLELAKEAMAKATFMDSFAKGDPPAPNMAMGTGYFWSDLSTAVQLQAKEFRQPVFLVNEIPRIKGKGGDATKYKIVTNLGSSWTHPGLAEGARGGQISLTMIEALAAYAHLGLERSETFEAELAGEILTPDSKAMLMLALAQVLRLTEEYMFFFGNSAISGAPGLALGVTPNPTIAAVASGGAIPDTTDVYVSVLALTPLCDKLGASVTAGVPVTLSRTNMDGSTTVINGGAAAISGEAHLTTGSGGGDNSVTAYVTAVKGATKYAWFWGVDAAHMTLGAITSLNSYVITVAAGTGTQLSTAFSHSTDRSQNVTEYSGLFYQMLQSGRGGEYMPLATGTPGTGTVLTSDGHGGINEFNEMLKNFWVNNYVSPTKIFVNTDMVDDLVDLSMQGTNGTNNMTMLRLDVQDGGKVLTGGFKLGRYFNKYCQNGQDICEIINHPEVPSGLIYFHTDRLPVMPVGVRAVAEYIYQRDYYGIEWPLKTRRWDYGVETDGVLQLHMPIAEGAITNVALIH